MSACTRKLLMIALGAALSPLAPAQTSTPLDIHAHFPTAQTTPPPSAPPPTGDDTAPQPARPVDAGDWRDASQAPAIPPASARMQEDTRAATHSAAASRDVFAALDANGDGRITAGEAAADAGFRAGFTTMDSDHDGVVTDAEYRAHAKAAMDTAQGAEHAAPHSAVVARDVFTRLDADHDGRISNTEAAVDSGFNGGFAAIDGNGDGFITDAEYRAHARTTEKPTRP